MKRNDIIEVLYPGVFIGLVIGYCLAMIVGVNEVDPLPNLILGILSCFLTTLLNTTVVLKMTAKRLNRKLTVKTAIAKTFRYTIMAGCIGFLAVAFITVGLNLDTREISTYHTALYQAPLAAVVSTLLAYIALKRYEKSVKYKKRRTKKNTKSKA